jgi:hypothetical protein
MNSVTTLTTPHNTEGPTEAGDECLEFAEKEKLMHLRGACSGVVLAGAVEDARIVALRAPYANEFLPPSAVSLL